MGRHTGQTGEKLMTIPTFLLLRASRSDVRSVLRQKFSEWGCANSWRETPLGPASDLFDISLSYAGGEGWIGFWRDGRIGIDAMQIEPFDERAAVASHFFSPRVCQAIEHSGDRNRSFALAWTDLEARVKCVKQNLIEWTPARDKALERCRAKSFVTDDGVAVTVAYEFREMPRDFELRWSRAGTGQESGRIVRASNQGHECADCLR